MRKFLSDVADYAEDVVLVWLGCAIVIGALLAVFLLVVGLAIVLPIWRIFDDPKVPLRDLYDIERRDD